MRTTVKVNGRHFAKCATHANARNWAGALYSAMADIILKGATEDFLSAAALKKLTRPEEDFIVTIGGENWEKFIPESEWISNLKRKQKAS